MKAVIVEKHDGFAVALRDDGCFVRVKGTSYEIGDQITLRSGRNGMIKKIVAAAAAFAVLVTGGGVGTNVYFAKETYSVVSMDINPSIEYSLNRFDKVIAVRGVNSEGEQIAGEISDAVISRDLSNALHTTLECLCEKSYITADEANYMVIGVYSKSAKKQESIGVTVAAFSDEETELCTVTAVNVTKEEKEVADSLGITAGKMILAVDAATAMGTDTSDADITELASLSVEELTNIASGNEVTTQEPTQVVEEKDSEEVVEEPKDSQAVSDNEAVTTVSDNSVDVTDVVSGDEVDAASIDKSSEQQDVSDDKGSAGSNTGSTDVSKGKTDDAAVSGDNAQKDSDADQSSSKKDEDKAAVSDNSASDENVKDDDDEADAISGSKKGDAAETSTDGNVGDEADAQSEKTGEEGVSVSKPKSSQYTGCFESGNNISISDTVTTAEEDPTI